MDAAFAMDWSPPRVIAATRMVRMMAVHVGETPTVIWVISTMELT